MSLGLAAVFGAGVLTYVTPCVLPLIPIYLAALAGGNVKDVSGLGRGQLLVRAGFFALGFVAVFTSMGMAASWIGAVLTTHRLTLQALGGVVVVLFALKFLGVIEIPLLDRVARADDRRFQTRWGTMNALLMGVLFAAGWSPCVGPVLGTVLTYTASTTSEPLVGAGYLATYGLGFAAPLFVTAVFAEAGLRWLRKLGPVLPRLERAMGVAMLVVAASLLFDFNSASEPAPVFAASAREKAIAAEAPRAVPTMLELYSSDCPICREMKSVVARMANECQGEAVDIELVDVSRPENRHYIAEHRLLGVPTFLFLDENRTEVARLVGKQSHEALHQALATLRGEACSAVGALPIDRDPVYEENPSDAAEEASCLSMTTSATNADTNSNTSSASPNALSRSSAPSVASSASACSLASP